MSVSSVLCVADPNGTALFGASGTQTGASSVATGLTEKLWFYKIRRFANVTPLVMRHDHKAAPGFHHILDPSTPASLLDLVWETPFKATVALGTVRTFAGFIANLSGTDSATLMGIGFYADSVDNLFHCFVRDCPTGVAPVTSRHDFATTVLQTSVHRLKFQINGTTKTITWYIDGVAVSTFTPAAVLDRMGTAAAIIGPLTSVGAFVPASGDVTVEAYAGCPAILRFKVGTVVGGDPPPASGGASMHVFSYRIKMPRPYMRQFPVPPEREVPYVEARVNGGLVTQIDSADIQNNEFAQIKNMFSRDDKIGRRYGTSLYTPVKPNASAILLIDTIKEYTGPVKIIRFSTTTVHKMDFGGAAWTAIAGPAFTADDTFRIKMVRLANRTFFTDGINNIKEIDLTANTYANAGNAPAAFIAGFFNRLVAARYALAGSENPVQIGWSGDTNFSEFDPLVDYSAGFTYLAESPSDYSDFITGLVPLANSMIVLKEKSIWLTTKQPSASNPFNFYTVVPGVSCDAPMTIQKITNGCVWYDSRIGTVFMYTVGMQEPENIGFKIARTFLTDIVDPNHCTSAYDPTNDEYSLILCPYGSPAWPQAGTTKIWRYNFRNKSWSYDEIMDVTSVDYIESVNIRKRIYGKFQGDLLVDDYTLYLPATLDTDNALAFTSTLVSKTFQLPKDDEYIQKLKIEYIPRLAGNFTLSYSKDNGATWVAYKTVTFLAGDVGLRKLATFNKNLKTRQYTWKLSGTTGLYDIIQFTITTYGGAPSKS